MYDSALNALSFRRSCTGVHLQKCFPNPRQAFSAQNHSQKKGGCKDYVANHLGLEFDVAVNQIPDKLTIL